jgi:hypothetical protein
MPEKLRPLNIVTASSLYVWIAFVLMLTIFHHPKRKAICLASFFARKKNRLVT